MAGRGRALRNGVAFDERTGFKEKGRRLRQDGERGILTTDPDPVHPQRFVRVPPPDGMNYRPGPPQRDAMGARIDLSYCVASVGRSGNQSSRLALQRAPSPFAACVCIGFPITVHPTVNIPASIFVTAVQVGPLLNIQTRLSINGTVEAAFNPSSLLAGSCIVLPSASVNATKASIYATVDYGWGGGGWGSGGWGVSPTQSDEVA